MMQSLPDRKTASFPWTALITTLVLWSSAFVGIRAALHDYSPFQLALLRYLTASACLLAVAFGKRIRLPELSDLIPLIILGFVGIGGYNIALNYGEKSVTAASASLIVNTAPIFTLIFSAVFLKEKVRWLGWLGMLVSFGGVSLIALQEGPALTFSHGIWVILAAAVCHSIYIIAQKPLLKKYSSLEVTAYAIWFGTILLLPFINHLLSNIRQAPLPSTLAVIYLGIFPGAIAYFSWSSVLAKLPAAKAASFLFLIPLITALIGLLWLHEIPKTLAGIGGLLAIGGVMMTNRSAKHKRLKPGETLDNSRESGGTAIDNFR